MSTTKADTAKVRELRRGKRVQNIVGSSEAQLQPTAKKFWSRAVAKQKPRAGGWPAQCCVQGCTNRAVDGGHVKVHKWLPGPNWDWYVVPVCKKHNKKASKEVLRVKGGTMAVRAPVSVPQRVRSWLHNFKKS